MKQYDELIQIAKKYACNKKGKDVILLNPIFRMENNLCLQYLVIEFYDEKNDDYRIKRPTEWLLQDMENGNIIGYYSILEKPYTNEDLPNTFTNNGKSIIFDYSNDIIKSFQLWRKKMVEDLTNNINRQQNLLYKSKVLEINNEIISPSDFILANIDDTLDNMMDSLENIGSTIIEAFKTYTISLFDKIRNDYINNNLINYENIKQYMNVLKYAWPEIYELINKSCNIKEAIDYDFDEYIQEMLNDKSIIKQIDNKLKEIDENYQPSPFEKKDEEKDYSNVTIHDLIESIDEKLKGLDD